MKAMVLTLLGLLTSATAFVAPMPRAFQAHALSSRTLQVVHAQREGGPNPDFLGNAPKTRVGNA